MATAVDPQGALHIERGAASEKCMDGFVEVCCVAGCNSSQWFACVRSLQAKEKMTARTEPQSGAARDQARRLSNTELRERHITTTQNKHNKTLTKHGQQHQLILQHVQ